MSKTDSAKLSGLITKKTLQALAGPRSFARGEIYFQEDRVDLAVTGERSVSASVHGTDVYAVRLWQTRGELDYECTCPVGDDGEFCKHAVAVGLAWLARDSGNDTSPPVTADGRNPDPVHAYLAAQDKQMLVGLFLEQAARDPQLLTRLQTTAVRHGNTPDLKTLREIVRKALAVHDFVDYYGMRRYLTRARPVLELLEQLIADKHGTLTVDLAEYAAHRGFAAYDKLDDSDGGFGQVLGQIAALHLEACRMAKPDGETLAQKLFELQMLDDWGFFNVAEYAPLLGKNGLARYRNLVEAAWRKIPARAPGTGRDLSNQNYRITAIMEALARQDGDTDALIAIKSRDLSSSHAFLGIAGICAQAGRHDEALVWAERGRKAFARQYNAPLVVFLTNAYHRARRHADAIKLAWEHYGRYPNLESYNLLKQCADHDRAWKPWREKALMLLRNRLKSSGRKGGHQDWGYGGNSLLVQIFLSEGDSDAAFAEAKAGGCTSDLWMQLAQTREREHPLDAVAIYQSRIDPIVDHKDNRAYDEAAALIGRIKGLMERNAQRKEFAVWLDMIRIKHKAKRNFMQRIENA